MYEDVTQETDEIVSIHVTSKHSATYNSALLGKEIAQRKSRRIEVIDSKCVTIWQGLVAIAAAKAAQAQNSLHQVIETVRETINQLHVLALLDTLAYIAKGGRVGKGLSAIESVLSVKPLLTLHDGQIRPAGLVRTRSKGIDRLREFVASALHIEDLAIAYNTTPDDARTLADHTSLLFPNILPRIARVGPALEVHAGPGALAVVLKGAK